MHNVVKYVNTAGILKLVWSFYNIMHERVKLLKKQQKDCLD